MLAMIVRIVTKSYTSVTVNLPFWDTIDEGVSTDRDLLKTAEVPLDSNYLLKLVAHFEKQKQTDTKNMLNAFKAYQKNPANLRKNSICPFINLDIAPTRRHI